MVNNLIVVGAGGHCRVILSVLKYYENFSVMGIADRTSQTKGEKISDCVIQYSWNDFKKIYKNGTRHAAIAIGNNEERKELFLELTDIGFKIPTIIHPASLIEKDAVIENGSLICMGAKIGTKVHIGKSCVVYTGSILDHEVKLGDFVYLSPGCNIAGQVSIDDSSFIGLGSTIIEKTSIGSNVTVGAGSVVLNNIPDNTVVAGVPAKKIK